MANFLSLLSGLFPLAIQAIFRKYKKTKDFKKAVLAFAVLVIYSVLSAVCGYGLLEKSLAASIVLFVSSGCSVFAIIYMFFVTTKAIAVTTKALERISENIPKN